MLAFETENTILSEQLVEQLNTECAFLQTGPNFWHTDFSGMLVDAALTFEQLDEVVAEELTYFARRIKHVSPADSFKESHKVINLNL